MDNLSELNTSYPGHVFNFDATTQTCEVQLAIETLFMGYESAFTVVPKQRLQNVPVQFIQGSGFSLTHPIPDGTPCYVHFAQRGIDHWVNENSNTVGLNKNGSPNPQFSQKFSVLNAVCVIGIQPTPKAIKSFQTNSLEIRNEDRSQRVTLVDSGEIQIVTGSTKITVTPDGVVEIDAPNSTTVKSPQITLDGITTVTQALIVQGGMTVSGGTGASMNMKGNVIMQGSFSLNGIKVDGHTHISNEAGKQSGVMQ